MIGLTVGVLDVVGNVTGPALPLSPDIGSVIQQFAQQFMAVSSFLLTTLNTAVIDVGRLAWGSLLLLGLFLYYTHAAMRLGKDLIKGGVLLAILVEFVFPYIIKL
jgi:hydrogenase-4 membrane subunit HyfE